MGGDTRAYPSVCSTGRVQVIEQQDPFDARTPDADRVLTVRPRRPNRSQKVELMAWIVVAAMGLLALTQAIGYGDNRLVAIVQALTPFLLAPAIPIAVVAVVRHRWLLGGVSTGIVVALVVLVAPVILHGSPPAVAADAPRLTVFHANFFVENRSPAAGISAVLSTGADVIELSEFNGRDLRLFEAEPQASKYPYRAGEPSSRDANGIILWSKYPLSDITVERIGIRPGIVATVDTGRATFRIVAIHAVAPTQPQGTDTWSAGLGQAAALGNDPGPRTVIVGDFNAARWHPALRQLLDDGWHDAHEWLGHGFSSSWPNDQGILPPPFLRLDHALVGTGLAPLSITDVDVPGSDHRGFVVTLAATGG